MWQGLETLCHFCYIVGIMKVIIKQHPGTGLWVSNDGRVILPPCPQAHRFKHTWTFGSMDKDGYLRALYAKNPEYAERRRISQRKYRALQKELGKHDRKCPDGKRRLLTDEEFDARFGKRDK